jgi:capsular polysaccharide transport system ATP-binding protein
MIRVDNVVKEYKSRTGRIRALDGLSLDVARGRRIGVLGRNGSGKSTLIRLVGGVEIPTTGTVTRDMSVSWPLGFRGGFEKDLSAYDNVRFLARIYRKKFEDIAHFVEEFSGLGKRLRDPIDTYSSGMRAKLSFGISLAIEFDCYLVDEIIAVGDPSFRRKCRLELFEKRSDRALLMVSHQERIIKQSCDIGVLIERGRHIDTFDIQSGSEWRRYVSPS